MTSKLVRALVATLALAAMVLPACTPPPAAPVPTPPTTAPATKPPQTAETTANSAVTPGATGTPSSCKVAQVYTSPTSDKGWSWSHEQSFLTIKKELPYVDLSIRKDSVRDDNQQAVTDLLESMVQQGARVVYTISFGFMEPTRAVAARHPDVAFFHASGYPDPKDPPNIGYYFAYIEEARFITGELAGLVVDPGANIGYVAAHPIPEVIRGENAFALGVMKTNPTAKIYNRWTLTWFDPKLEKEAAESLLEPPVRAQLITQHQDSTAPQLAAQAAGKLGIAYHADMNDAAPKATLTAATWNWAVHNKPTVEAVCTGKWTTDGKVTIPLEYKNWMGSMKDGAVGVAPLNVAALENHPRKDRIQKLYTDEVEALKTGAKRFETIWTDAAPVKDQAGKVRIESGRKLDIAALYDDRHNWFVENVVGSPSP